MKNPLASIPKRETTFIAVVLVVLIIMIAFDTNVDILVNYDEEMLQVTSPRLNIDIEHAQVQSVELIDMPEFGTKVGDSYEHEAYCAGTWQNDAWDDYTLCVIPTNSKCIFVKLELTTVVFSCTTDEKTVELYESYSAYLNK